MMYRYMCCARCAHLSIIFIMRVRAPAIASTATGGADDDDGDTIAGARAQRAAKGSRDQSCVCVRFY